MIAHTDIAHLIDLSRSTELVGVSGEEADVLVSCASASIRVHAFEDAHAILRAALLVDPEHARAWALYGIVLEMTHHPEDARIAYGKALLHDDEDPITALALARLHDRFGDTEKARALLSWILTAFPKARRIREQARTLLRGAEGKAAV